MTIRYICWQPLLTDHQAYTYSALHDEADGQLSVNVSRTHDVIRAEQGWINTGGNEIEKRNIPEKNWLGWAKDQFDRYPDAIHLFGSPFEQRRQIQIMAMACRKGCKVAIISEPFSTNRVGYLADNGRFSGWLKAKLRPLLYRAYGLYFGRRIHAVFGISPLACDQYAAMGVAPTRIFPFGYFVPSSPIAPIAPKTGPTASLRLIFVGALIARKGLTIAIDAVRRLRNEGHGVTLDVYGAGDPAGYALGDAIRYMGVIPFGRAGEIIARYDALVVPSLFDGWAVVVNEALQTGTPVCCSDSVGAGALVRAHGAGATFPADDLAALSAVLRRWISDRDALPAARAAAWNVAPLLEPIVAAGYMHQALTALEGEGARPESLWYPWRDGTPA